MLAGEAIGGPLWRLSGALSVVLQLLNVVYQAIQLPLALNLSTATQAEAIQPLVGTDIAKYRLDYRHSVAVDRFALGAVHAVLHPVRITGWPVGFELEGYLSSCALAVLC